ncbi:MAG: Ferrous iron transport protein [Pseudomonadota bacterium]
MKRIAMLGMPNTGKSTLFNRLTGSHAKVGNWPGLTVDLMTARLLIGDQMVQLVDLPGIYDIDGYSEDERVVTRFIAENTIDIGLFVLNVTQLDRQLPLLLQVLNQNFPVVVVLNMADEASALGISIDPVSLATGLGVPVCLLSAKYGQGMEQLMASLRAEIVHSAQTEKVERPARPSRLEFLEATVKSSVQIPIVMSTTRTEKIDKVLLNTWLGLPLFFLVMFLLFELVFAVGKPIQDLFAWGFAEIRVAALEPLVQTLPPLLQGLLLDGVYNGLSTVASFVPIIILFFLCMGIVED